MLMMNEKIKAREVLLTGLNGEDMGVVSRDEALALAKSHKADLVCTSLFSSPPAMQTRKPGAGEAGGCEREEGPASFSRSDQSKGIPLVRTYRRA